MRNITNDTARINLESSHVKNETATLLRQKPGHEPSVWQSEVFPWPTELWEEKEKLSEGNHLSPEGTD